MFKEAAVINIDVKINPVYLPFLNKKQFMQIFFGGSSSGKSYFICQKVVIDNMNGANWLVCRNVARTIRISVFNEIKKAITRMGLSQFYRINGTDMVITNLINNKQILFAGLDDPEKIKSISPAEGVLERIFIEEATEVKRSAILQLKKRLRGKSPISKQMILAFNPILKSHYIYKDYFKGWNDTKNLYEDRDLLILKTTYKDNLFLTEDDRRLLEDESDPYYYNVYTLGNWGVLGHIIFKNWHTADLSELIPQFDHIFNGCDFGYSADPNAVIRLHLDKKRKKIYIFDELYRTGMTDELLAFELRNMIHREIVTCDSAEPKTINYLCGEGLNAVGAIKGADSINRGIRYLQGYEIIVHTACQNCINELEQYHWKEDKYGNAMAVACDENNHLMDAMRYALCDEILAADVTVGKRI